MVKQKYLYNGDLILPCIVSVSSDYNTLASKNISKGFFNDYPTVDKQLISFEVRYRRAIAVFQMIAFIQFVYCRSEKDPFFHLMYGSNLLNLKYCFIQPLIALLSNRRPSIVDTLAVPLYQL